jgi:hypothetical protein
MDLLDVVTKPPPISPKLHVERKVMVQIEGRLVEAVMPGNKEEFEKFETENKDWVKKNRTALRWITNSVDGAYMPLVSRCTTAKDAWDNLNAKRYNRTVTEMARAMIIDANLSNFFWPLAVECANHVKNRLTHASLPPNTTPYEAFNGSKPDISYFRLFGSKCFAPTFAHQHKMAAKGIEGTFVGYAPRAKGYLFWDKQKKDVYVRRDLNFDRPGIKSTHVAGESAKENVDYGAYMPLFDNPTKDFINDDLDLEQRERR